jgi:hypothetical protein
VSNSKEIPRCAAQVHRGVQRRGVSWGSSGPSRVTNVCGVQGLAREIASEPCKSAAMTGTGKVSPNSNRLTKAGGNRNLHLDTNASPRRVIAWQVNHTLHPENI